MRHELSASGHPVASFLEFMLHIRLATAADAALVARLGAALFAQAVAERNSAEDMRDYLTHAFGESVQARELADTNMRTWIAEDGDGVAVGYVQLRQESQPPVGSLQRPAELARIYSDARWHGRGVGPALLETCVAAARAAGATDLWLAVWKLNPRGIAFYEKHGFRIVGQQIFQLGTETQTDWVMVRSLR
ncbi:MAG TPA: GNAT family N-acetyltransferase [Gemmatimonadaceae bacterium]|nr:GNAT family N-acetyltransferase [Gemmatimonadaceae bacterium]